MPQSEPPERSSVTRVLLVDDQPLFRRAIATLIAEQPDFTVVGEAVNGQDALERARALAPDLVVMDIEMPVMNGVEAVRRLRDDLPEIKVVVLTVSEDEDYLFDAVRFGAHGYLLKDLQPEHLYEMLRAVVRGESPISPVIAGRLLAEFRRRSPGEPLDAAAASRPAHERSHLPPRPPEQSIATSAHPSITACRGKRHSATRRCLPGPRRCRYRNRRSCTAT